MSPPFTSVLDVETIQATKRKRRDRDVNKYKRNASGGMAHLGRTIVD